MSIPVDPYVLSYRRNPPRTTAERDLCTILSFRSPTAPDPRRRPLPPRPPIPSPYPRPAPNGNPRDVRCLPRTPFPRGNNYHGPKIAHLQSASDVAPPIPPPVPDSREKKPTLPAALVERDEKKGRGGGPHHGSYLLPVRPITRPLVPLPNPLPVGPQVRPRPSVLPEPSGLPWRPA